MDDVGLICTGEFHTWASPALLPGKRPKATTEHNACTHKAMDK